jgi:hypothetical protein
LRSWKVVVEEEIVVLVQEAIMNIFLETYVRHNERVHFALSHGLRERGRPQAVLTKNWQNEPILLIALI